MRLKVIVPSSLAGLAVILAVLWFGGPLASSVMFVKGSSMTPLLQPGQVLLVNRDVYRGSEASGPRRGDLVVFRRTGEDADRFVVKRVIGLPGERVQVEAGRVFVNGAQLDEPYVRATDDYSFPLQGGPVRVPDRSYFVLGDNRPSSADSHLGWFVPAADLLGQASPLPLALPWLAAVASA